MKGIFTQIKYEAQGVILREAKKTGMIVGLPISTEHRKQIMLGDAVADYTAASGVTEPSIDIYADNQAFDYIDGDKLNQMRMWIRKSSEPEEDAVEIVSTGETAFSPTLTNYDGTAKLLGSALPVAARDIGAAICTFAATSVTFSFACPEVAVGDTICGTVAAVSHIGKITALSYGESVGMIATVSWNSSTPSGNATQVKVYYDYTMDPSNGNPRGYVLYFDSIVYRTSVYGVHTVSRVEDITAMFGENSISNPLSNLAMGAFLFMGANGMRDKFKVCAIDMRGQADYEDTPDDYMSSTFSSLWAAAITKVDAHKDAYYLSVMSNDEVIQDLWIGYTNTSSEMERQREKRYYLSKAIISYDPADESDVVNTFGNGKFLDSDYEPGAKYADGYGTDGTFDKDADIEAAMATTMAYNNERLTIIGCEWATVGDVNIEGYHISAIIAGWRSSLALGYVMDDMKVPLITSIPCSDSYYTEDDFDALANSGWYMLQQQMSGSPVVCYMQKTSAYDSVEKGEESFIVALDSAMRDIRETLAPYIKGGLDNRVSGSNPDSPVTVRYLKKLNSAISMVRYKYITENEVFATMEIVSIKVHEMKKTASEIKVKFSHYYPNREIYVIGYVE